MGIYGQIAAWYDELFPVGEEQAAFFARLLRDNWCKSVLDVGCGTGRHLELFSDRGLKLAGLEPEAEMADRAAERLRARGADCELAVCPMEDALERLSGPYDVAVCLGNTLCHLSSRERLIAGLNVVSRLLTPWGLLVTQTVNFDRALRERDWPFPERRIVDPRRGELRFRRRYLFGEDSSPVTFRLELTGDGLSLCEEITLKPYTLAEQESALARCGFRVEESYGDWDGRPFDDEAPALIIVARRA